MFDILSGLVASGSSVTTVVAGAIEDVDFSGILSELIALLPVVLPTVVGFIGIRKALSFLIGSLRRA